VEIYTNIIHFFPNYFNIFGCPLSSRNEIKNHWGKSGEIVAEENHYFTINSLYDY
jgi:hypothetical protein